jgi:glycerol-3-phosphate dehydrogenase
VLKIADGYNISEATVKHLLDRYGSLISEILEIITADPSMAQRLIPDLPYLKAEVLHAASHEGALSVEDVLLRRTRISFEASDSGLSAADTVAEIIGETLGWKSADRKNSVQSFAKVISEEESALKALVNS